MPGERNNLNPVAWSYAGWQKFFLVAGLWNLSGAVPSLIWPAFNLRVFYGLAGADYHTLFLNRGLWWAVLLFGLGYLLAATSPGRHWGIILLGALGKIVIAVHWFYLAASAKATAFAFLAATGDSAFTVLFVLYLAAGPRKREERTPLAPPTS